MALAFLVLDRNKRLREAGRELLRQLGILPNFPVEEARPKMLKAEPIGEPVIAALGEPTRADGHQERREPEVAQPLQMTEHYIA